MLNSAADIRIGDMWGTRYADSSAGVSAVLAMSPKGKRVLDEIGDRVELHPETAEVAMEGQMRRCAQMPWAYNAIMRVLRSEAGLKRIKDTVIWRYRLTLLPLRVWNRLKRFAK